MTVVVQVVEPVTVEPLQRLGVLVGSDLACHPAYKGVLACEATVKSVKFLAGKSLD